MKKEPETMENIQQRNLPEDWKLVKLEEVADIRGNKSKNGIEQVAFIPMDKVPDSEIYAEFEVRKREDVKSFTYCEAGDLLLAKITPSVENGKQGIVPENIPNNFALATTEVFPIVCKDLDVLFLFYVLKYTKFRNKLIASMIGTTGRQRVSKQAVKNLQIPLPPLPEQKKIAEILSTVDSAIQQTDEAIAKAERLKKGLMQELLTKGIKHEHFKETDIGRIPEEWEVVRLGDEKIATIRGNKTTNDFKEIAFIPMDLIPDSNIYAEFEIRKREDVKSFTYCEAGDLLLAKITPSVENGKQGIVPENIPNNFALATTEVFPIVCKDLDVLFLFYVLKYPKFRNKLIASMIGTTGRQRVSKQAVKNLQIPLPPLLEQKKIAEMLGAVDEKIAVERERKEKYERIKKGLMNDLLTGKKRVKVEKGGQT